MLRLRWVKLSSVHLWHCVLKVLLGSPTSWGGNVLWQWWIVGWGHCTLGLNWWIVAIHAWICWTAEIKRYICNSETKKWVNIFKFTVKFCLLIITQLQNRFQKTLKRKECTNVWMIYSLISMNTTSWKKRHYNKSFTINYGLLCLL